MEKMASSLCVASPTPHAPLAAAAASSSTAALFPSHLRFRKLPNSPAVRLRSSAERQVLFNRIAPVYDGLNDLLTLGLHRVWKRMAVSWSGAKKGDSVLDLCCGSGDLTFLLSEKVGPQGEVTGLDFSTEQLSIASTRQDLSGKTCYRNIVWLEGDALNLCFPACYFDAITVGYGLRNVVDKQKALEEIFRVLKRGSRVSILDFNKSSNALTTLFQEYMIDNVVVPAASSYGLAKEYAYLKTSIQEFLTGILFPPLHMEIAWQHNATTTYMLYLRTSIQENSAGIAGKELEELAKEVGFSYAKHYEISGGLMGNLVATR